MSSSCSDKYFEAVEVCPFCESENIYPLWDVTKMGYVAQCGTCGERVMLCDECMHADDNIERKCDWTENGWPSGVCFRDDREVTLYTHDRSGNANYNYRFDVPRNWLRKYLLIRRWNSLEEFMNTYTDFDGYFVYKFAEEDGVISNGCFLDP